jgi:kumamolisin
MMRPYNLSTAVIKTDRNIFYTAADYAKIYNFPTPAASSVGPVIAVISLGGGLKGTVTNSVLTGGDVQAYWSSLAIPAAVQARVIIVPIDGAVHNFATNDGGASAENTLDVAMIGGAIPFASARIVPVATILLILAPNSYRGFLNAFRTAINGSIRVGSSTYSPTIISCSWGAPEKQFTATYLTQYNAAFATAVTKRINIFCATGDYGSSNGLYGLNVDFPSSSPNVVACGGTTLVCPGGTYIPSTQESAWLNGGGGVSAVFAPPAYQKALRQRRRATPDIALNANPSTGFYLLFNGAPVAYGGTSVVSPAMAAFAATLGPSAPFLNARLYAVPKTCFNDIVRGTNSIRGTGTGTSYVAGAGFDNCTGLGSINGALLKTSL